MRQKVFTCVKSNKVVFCIEDTDEGTLEFGMGFLLPELITSADKVIEIIRSFAYGSEIFPYSEGSFDNFVTRHSATMKEIK